MKDDSAEYPITMNGILPAAGQASRMRGIPKFLLPCDEKYTTLLEYHCEMMLKKCELVWIPTRTEFVHLIESLKLPTDRVVVIPMNTASMTETVMRILGIAKADNFALTMPDTFFDLGQPLDYLDAKTEFVDLGLIKIRDQQRGKLGQCEFDEKGRVTKIVDKDYNCDIPFAWGALTFSRNLEKFMNSNQPHIGYAISQSIVDGCEVSSKIIPGNYYDCGTPSEYLSLLTTVI
jgi:hypothetical protein